MADFARWAKACGDGFLWDDGEFEQAYRANRKAAIADVIEADSVAVAVRDFMRECDLWEGTNGDLGRELARLAGEKVTKTKAWPDNPRALRSALQRVQAPLRKIGVVVTFAPQGRRRLIRIQTARSANDRHDRPDRQGRNERQ
jgi:hypothetical protein